ncbi:MAG TPA: type III pantothenate kinase [Thermodesulfovibrionales bacterium]|nr:type III pantothenate kinase [Thermodesulfovibrionales bacterium]
MGKTTLLAIDIGNSSISMGFFTESRLLGKLAIPSSPKKESNYYKKKIKTFLSKNCVEIPLGGVIISSVVPELTGTLNNSVNDLSDRRPMVVKASLNTGLEFDVESPDKVGGDRISNAVAARELYGSPVLVVDFGTATSMSAVKGRRFVGGAILPGLRLMGDSLHRGTAKLPPVNVKTRIAELRIPAVGKNTAMCIMSGILYGLAGAAERLIEEMEDEEHCKFRIVVTGGHCREMAHFLRREHHSDPDLTLKGLNLIFERNATCMN